MLFYLKHQLSRMSIELMICRICLEERMRFFSDLYCMSNCAGPLTSLS